MSKIKICGLRRMEDIAFINEYRPDYAGFVFSKSKRRVTPAQAQVLKKALHPDIQAAGVFVNEPVPFIVQLVNLHIIDLVQLHGDEDEAYITALKKSAGCPIIKAVRVQNQEQVINAQRLPCDYLLLDTFSKNGYGGTGSTFDWSMIPDNLKKPFFLAGGLTCENIAHAAKAVRPYCLDVSSGAETNGDKDRDKIQKLIEMVRSV